jgi:Cellulase (glycosyl hydrolase family 5)
MIRYYLFILMLISLSAVFLSCNEVKRTLVEDDNPWSQDKTNLWYGQQSWLVGFNYVPSYACNTTECWQKETFDLKTMDRELGWASDLGYNTARVFIQYIVWKDNPEEFKKRFEQFLNVAEKHKISVMPVLFDDCAFGSPIQPDPFLGKQREPIPGMIAPSWTPSPGKKLGSAPKEKPILEKYVKDMISSFKSDKRIVIWDLYNEPLGSVKVGKPAFLKEVFVWAREANPTQPMTVGIWNDTSGINRVIIENSDVISFHAYTDLDGMKNYIKEFKKYGRPVLNTEWMARVKGSSFSTELPLFKSENVGCYQWGLVNGRTQCQYPWSNKPNGEIDPETGWFHDILHKDGTAYRKEEIDIITELLKRE